MAWPGWLTFDPIVAAPAISSPTLIVHSADVAIPRAPTSSSTPSAPQVGQWRQVAVVGCAQVGQSGADAAR
ncbi:hypothetical protein SAMN05661080_04696 [Modestobacter sp. DSM 44400]|nr:hypothetical protein SAMN05661080_04696 [Modestobacter sp. DSM 44400]